MRWSERKDGGVTIYDDTDLLVVEPTITAFKPTGWCDCRSIRCAVGGIFEIYCLRCHKAHARFDLGTKVHG
jgi:hypothetical protein